MEPGWMHLEFLTIGFATLPSDYDYAQRFSNTIIYDASNFSPG